MKVLDENFRFMVLEVVKQVENTQRFLDHPGSVTAEAIENRDDYIDNLKSVIENDCFSRIHGQYLDKRTVDRIRATNIVSNNLERLGDHAVNIVLQTPHLTDIGFLHAYDYQACFDEILKALNRVHDALTKQDMALAFKICTAEFNLDALYKQNLDRVLAQLRTGTDTGNLVTTLFIFRYLERMGDAILNMGEAIIFSITGEKFKIHQYTALTEILGSSADVSKMVDFESIWGTRSGCRIGKVMKEEDGKGPAQSLIFKEGSRKKLLQEKENIEHWETIMPGLPPKVQALQEDGGSVSLLIEYLGGCTFQDVVLSAEWETLKNATFLVFDTVAEIWESTRKEQPVSAQFMAQTESRLTDVFRLHPEFDFPVMDINGAYAPSPRELLARAKELEKGLTAPLSVHIHGDFNINNIIYNHEEQRIHYIDLHRSRDSDYVQDVSVFLVSNFRLPVFQEQGRHKLDFVEAHFLNFARAFAEKNTDTTFEARLCLGLARSFMTSSRFELNKPFARRMYLRGIYLLRKFLAHAETRPPEEFKLPAEALHL